MRGPAGRLLAVRFFAARPWAAGVVIAAIMTLLGPLAGLLWAVTVPEVTYVIVQGEALLADPEGQGPIGVDARFALVCAVAGLLCGAAAYRAGGRRNDIALLLGLALGGCAAALLAWRTGHAIGLADFQEAVRTAPDRTTVTGVAELRAKGLLVSWALPAVAAYALLELVVKRLPAGDRGEPGAGEPDEVGGHQLDLQSAPAGRDVDGGER
ncbi:hypothetical protein [Actinomadura livida]|uniref:DUF2567 domain-containing protein n=1 Tax=Actinomadura livida TaxID=79909 RepID=A0A7W7IFV0_9ACTN|nr:MULTISPECIES: hypothetical protein [Actinomadura]MBB4776327.1 hypothetical protein [Actinomadura catellatispora]GGU32474.1 hypothetical protein GCM10010208_66390 [Actinomadura livida]